MHTTEYLVPVYPLEVDLESSLVIILEWNSTLVPFLPTLLKRRREGGRIGAQNLLMDGVSFPLKPYNRRYELPGKTVRMSVRSVIGTFGHQPPSFDHSSSLVDPGP